MERLAGGAMGLADGGGTRGPHEGGRRTASFPQTPANPLAASEWGGVCRLGKKEVEKEWRGILVFSPYSLTDLLGRVNGNGMEVMKSYKRWHRRDELIFNDT